MKNEMDSSPKSEIILYQPNETVSLEVRMENETVWLSINQMSELFGRDKSVISRHIAAIYNDDISKFISRRLLYRGNSSSLRKR